MESDSDLPLIEIAGEDDSLLQLTLHGAVSTSTTTNKNPNDDTYFFCSPLQLPRSKPKEGVKVNGDSQKPRSPYCGESTNKENSYANKIQEKKFSLQPQQMKKKKKGGGYNLRKSLAWDRAFSEEQGVLNSEELSLITGSVNSSGLLSVIHEETNCISDSANLQELEENLFKVIPGSTPKKDRIVGGSPLPKHASSARDNAVPGSAARRKVLSARDTNRSGSKRSGCPRPVASSSLKRPANVNTIKSATKEPKVSKLPVPKPVPCALSKTSKNVTVGASDLKRSQIAHPEVNLNNTKTGLNNAKVGPTGKSLTAKSCTRPARRNVPSLVKSSPTKTPCPPVTEANNGLEVISKQALPSTRHTSYGRDDRSRKTAVPEEVTSKQALPSAGHVSYSRDDRLRKIAVPLPRTGVNLPHTGLQTSKPSGLRMPSPSLSFFNQSKASSLPVPHKSSSQPCQIPNLKQIGSVNPIQELRPPSLGKMPNVSKDGTVMENINVQCSSSGSVPSAINPAAMDEVDSVSQIRHMQAELKVPPKSKGYGMTEDPRKLNSILVHDYQQSTPQAEPNITEEISCMEDVEFQRSDDKYLMAQVPSLVFPPKGKEIQSYSFMKVADASPEVQNRTEAEYKIFDSLSDSRCEDQAKDDSSAFETMSRNPHVEDAQMLASDGKTDEIDDVKLSTSAPDNCQLAKIDSGSKKPEHQDLSNPCYIGEQVYQDDRLILNDSVLDGCDVFPEKSQQNNALQSVESMEPEGNGACITESEISRNLYVIPPVMLDCRSNEVEMVDSPNVENIALISEDNRSVVENYNLDTQFRNDIHLHGQSCLELQNMDEVQSRVALTAHDIKTTLKSGDSTSQLNLTTQVEAVSATKPDTIEHGYLGFKGFDLSVESGWHAPQLQLVDDIVYCHQDTSMAEINFMGDKINVSEEETNVLSGEIDDGKHNVQQAKQVMSYSSIEARILNWNPGAHGVSFEGSKSVEECDKFTTGNSEDISSKVNFCDGSELQSPPDLYKRGNLEVANGGNDVIKETVPGAPQDPPQDQFSVANCRYSVDVNNAYELSGCPKLQHPNIGAVQVSQEFKPRSHFNVILLANNSCKEYEETVNEYNSCGSEPKCSNACTEVAPAICDGRPDLGEKVDYSQLEHAVTRTFMIEQSSENVHGYTKSRDDSRLCNQAASVESDSSSKTTNEEDSVRTLASDSLEGELRLSRISDQTSSSESILQDNEVNILSSNTLAEDAETSILKSNHTLDSELQQELDDTMYPPPEDKDAGKELKKSGSGRKQDALVIKPPSHAVPFSDEWLAAIEAAGEEILTKKGGAVQNSPPNKSQPQLGPYSPVKRKQNQVIGPFDCTKHTNNPPGSQ